MNGKRILIIEDEVSISDIVKFNLVKEGYEVETAYDGEEGLRKALGADFDLILLDIMLPHVDGFQVCRKVRETSSVPIIMVTAKEEEVDKVLGLELGADDYLTKPFGAVELLARIRAALRHTRTVVDNDGIALSGCYTVGTLTVDYRKHRVYRDGVDTNLTPTEFKIVALLGKHAGQVLTYRHILRELWGPSASTDNKILRVHMANIRRKIEPNPDEPVYIMTEIGVGYRMAEDEG